jgi:hypothetical protein
MGNASVKARHHSKAHTHKKRNHSNYKYRHTKRNHRRNHKHCHCKRKNCNHRNCKCKNCHHKYHGGSPSPITGSPLKPGSKSTTSGTKKKNRKTEKSLLSRLQDRQATIEVRRINKLIDRKAAEQAEKKRYTQSTKTQSKPPSRRNSF